MKLTIIYEQVESLVQASVAELPGAISSGSTREEARASLGEAVEMVLEGNRLPRRSELQQATAKR